MCDNCNEHNKTTPNEDDFINYGALVAARMFKDIAESGQHNGTFAGEELEATAQAVLKLHSRINELEDKLGIPHSVLPEPQSCGGGCGGCKGSCG